MIIYKVTNKINGKIYIGATTKTLGNRKRNHISESKGRCLYVFHKALKKYGDINFIWEIIDTAQTQKELFEKETYYIQLYDTYKNGYNSTLGGDNTTFGYRFSDEQKTYFSKTRCGEQNPNYNHKWTDEQKKSMSIKMKLIDEEHKTNGIINPSKRPDIRKKLSDGKMGKLNPNANEWLLISPEGVEYKFTGGLKRFLKDHNLSYTMMLCVINGKRKDYKGWKICKIC